MAIYVGGKEVGVVIGEDTSDATAKAEDIIQGKTAYTCDGKIVGTFLPNDVDALLAGNLFQYLNENMIEQIMTGNYIIKEGE